ncbi:UNVERIFIED_CONTAM: hypothetical protein GTU68_052581 [Idotea baltica]|nr:hypothetical protein [Idotea baltica]
MREPSKAELGWQPFFEKQLSEIEANTLIVARVSAHLGGQVVLLTTTGELILSTSLLASSVAVGDWFLLDPDRNHRAVRRLERQTQLSRKAAGEATKPQLIAANIDTAFIVTSCNQDFNLSRVERYLALILDSKAMPIVILTKADQCDDPADFEQSAERLMPGLIVQTLDARDPDQATKLMRWCGIGQTVAMLGSSGVGKSTLANALCGGDIKTRGIREDDAKGRHTTTARSMHRLLAGGLLIDNPGIRELQLPGCEQGLDDLFDDIVQWAKQCKFRNCQHKSDAGCALKAAVETGELEHRRFENYMKLLSEQARNSASLADRRERDKQTGKMYKRIISEKKHRRQN